MTRRIHWLDVMSSHWEMKGVKFPVVREGGRRAGSHWGPFPAGRGPLLEFFERLKGRFFERLDLWP